MLARTQYTKTGKTLTKAIRPDTPLDLSTIPESAEAICLWSLFQARKQTMVCITDGVKRLDLMQHNLLTLAPEKTKAPLIYPAWESQPGSGLAPNPDIVGDRFSALHHLKPDHEPCLILTSIQALMQLTLTRSQLEETSRMLSVGDEVDLEQLTTELSENGYDFKPEVEAKGDASLRGGILDIWPLIEELPLRCEFFGTELDSIRCFNPFDQKSVEKRIQLIIPPADEWKHMTSDTGCSLLDYLPDDTPLFFSQYDHAMEQARDYHATLSSKEARALIATADQIHARHADPTRRLLIRTGATPGVDTPPVDAGFQAMDSSFTMPREMMEPDLMERSRLELLDQLATYADEGYAITITFDTESASDRFRSSKFYERVDGKVAIALGILSEGYLSDTLKSVVISENDLYGRQRVYQTQQTKKRRKHKQLMGSRVSNLADIEPGDLVVHVTHGIGRYMGMETVDVSGREQEALAIEYADDARLYVPVSQTQVLSRYIGVGGKHVRLHKIGGKRWVKERSEAQNAIADMAAQLLETQAARDALKGHACKPDTPWQHEFEAAFPYEETIDQLTAISEIKQDMESERPMDRLICGDVGYGKTEVAIRAAFKAIMDGKQVAMLVPTTILARQHFRSFTQRMAAYPIEIRMLSRFCTQSQQRDALAGIHDGSIDILIGTHALIQDGVRFKDLGLVIIDEEQRFGVKAKEKFKQLRRLVDILTLTATPIPRTLYFGLTGVKDLSVIQTPPQDRLSVETIATHFDKQTIRTAIQRELSRDGQVYFLHNRVRTIHSMEKRLLDLMPGLRIGVGHGQMSSGELAQVMDDFTTGRIDLLLCTTIIESGVDIPNANTIIIDRADRFGMSDLYQLRGRVGRSRHKAYCYLLLPERGQIDPTARKRVQSMQQYTSLGSAFKLALRDLEIRGAGNMLGTQQSGHIAAVGFQLYCQLLKRTVAQLKGDADPPVVDVDVNIDFVDLSPEHSDDPGAACIPFDYIEDERPRVMTYRRIAELVYAKDVKALKSELNDRFGSLPPAMERLLVIVTLRIAACKADITHIDVREGTVRLKKTNGEYVLHERHFPVLKSGTPDQRLKHLHTLIKNAG